MKIKQPGRGPLPPNPQRRNDFFPLGELPRFLDSIQGSKAASGRADRGRRDRVGCIVLGRGENDEKVKHWLQTAAGVPGFIGFAVGRSTFWNALVGGFVREGARGVTAR